MLRILSLGAGVQSSAVLMMVEHGELPPLDHAIFADTGDEPDAVYDWLDWLKARCRTPIHVVHRGFTIRDHVRERVLSGRRLDKPPFFTETDGVPGPINRDCTREWKVAPIRRRVKQLLGLKPGQRWPKTLAVEQWLGISADEIQRMKVSDEPWQRFYHPLLETEAGRFRMPGINRQDCLRWMRDKGYPEPPRSACWHCPYRSNAQWRWLRDNEPESWRKAIEYDAMIRTRKIHGMNNDVFLHRSLVPLDQANIEPEAMPLFDDECAGICGV